MTRSFTGRTRRRKTAPSVRMADRCARLCITLGGLGTIAAVTLVCVYLASVVVPLFTGAAMDEREAVALPDAGRARAPLAIGVDEYGLLAWSLAPDGELTVAALADGAVVERRALAPDGDVRALNVAGDGAFALATADGAVRIGRIAFQPHYLADDELTPELRALEAGETRVVDVGVAEALARGRARVQRLALEVSEPIALGVDAPVLLVDHSVVGTGPAIVALTADGRLWFRRAYEKRNLMTGEVRTTLRGGEVAVEPRADGAAPRHLLLAGRADTAYLVWPDGETRRYDTRDPSAPVLAEVVDLAPEPGAVLTAVSFLIGKTSLLTGDDGGRVRSWFRTKPDGAETADGSVVSLSHTVDGASAVRALAASARDRKAAAGFADGAVVLLHVTTEQELAVARTAGGALVGALAFSPKDDTLLAAAGDVLHRWDIDAPHPESTLAAMFRPVWYEGYERPAHVWQSTGGTDEFEPKYGLAPLVFGSLKATFYSMLFAVPIALLAAIYTSEFLKPRVRARIKPAIELMASLPSVVLGFLAAIVVAPFVERIVPAVLASFFTVPFFVLLGAYLWNLLPERRALAWTAWRLPAAFVMVPIALWAARLVGPWLERTWFWVATPEGPRGDIRVWLSGAEGASGAGGWMIALLPAAAALVAWTCARWVNPALRSASVDWTRARLARWDLAKFLAASAMTVLVALAGAASFDIVVDARDAFLGTYVQRNALVVGFVMAFAIIPIIYTIAEDALSAVPEQLRAASLGAGATPWQTALRIVVPTAMSGLFSAVMIGFGRAVGETMIVLMAAGNTPVLDWNVFNGFRTLSANIAVEMPEAAAGTTHYRMLFFAALVLFAMTFVLNTVAEAVRQRFRKRAYQL